MKDFSDAAHELLVAYQIAHEKGEGWQIDDHCDDEKLRDEFRLLYAHMGYDRPSATHTPQSELPPNTARYQFQSIISAGGMGVVYRAYDSELNRAVAIKVLRRPIGLTEFQQEAELLATLDHPNIVPIHDIQRFPTHTDRAGQPFFVMKLIHGSTLEAELADAPKDPATIARFVELVEQVARTVGYAHTKGILHRDLKPKNVMIETEYNIVRVIDFGIAKLMGSPTIESEIEREAVGISSLPLNSQDTVDHIAHGGQTPQNLTQTGIQRGTYAYMAPEQLRRLKNGIHYPTDVYALGAILVQIFIGRPPLTTEQAIGLSQLPEAEYLEQFTAKIDTCLNQIPAQSIDPGLRDIIRKCLHVDSQQRYANAGVLADALQEYQNQQVEKLAKARRLRRSAIQGSFVLGLLFLLSSGAALAINHYRLEAVEQRDENLIIAEDNYQQYIENWRLAELERKLRELAEERERQAKLQAAELSFDKGLREADQNRNAEGAGWMLNAGELAPPNDPIQGAICANVAEMLERVPDLESIIRFDYTPMALVFDPSGKHLISAGSAASFDIWEVATGKLAAHVALPCPINALALHPDGKTLYLGGTNGQLIVYDIARATPVAMPTIPGHEGAILAVAIHPDGKHIATGGNDGQLIIRETASGKVVWNVKPHGRPGGTETSQTIRSVAFNADGSWLVTGGYDGAFVVLDWAEKKTIRRLVTQVGNPVWHVAWLPVGDTEYVVTGSFSGTVTIWDVGTGKPFEVANIGSTITALGPQPNRDKGELFVAGLTMKAQVMNATQITMMYGVQMPSIIQTATWNVQGTRFAVGAQSEIRIWNINSRMPLHVFDLESLDPDEKFLIGGTDLHENGMKYIMTEQSRKGRIWLHEFTREKIVQSKLLHTFNVGSRQVRFSPDGGKFLIGLIDNSIELWQVAPAKRLWQIECEQSVMSANTLIISADQHLWAASLADGTVMVGEMNNGGILKRITIQNEKIWSICFDHTADNLMIASSPNGNNTVGDSGKVSWWKWRTEDAPSRSQVTNFVPQFSRLTLDGKSILLSGLSDTILRFDIASGAPILPAIQAKSSVRHFAFSHDGEVFAILLRTGEVERRHWPTLRTIGTSWPTSLSLNEVAFTLDQRLVVTGAIQDSNTVDVMSAMQWTHPHPISSLAVANQRFSEVTGLKSVKGAIEVMTAAEWNALRSEK